MPHTEKRKFHRLDSLHLLDYHLVDSKGVKSEYSMARALDVSINGIKLETVKEIPRNSTLMITLGIEDNLVDIEGQVTHTHISGSRFTTGIEFVKASAKNRKLIRQYVETFKSKKDMLLFSGKNHTI